MSTTSRRLAADGPQFAVANHPAPAPTEQSCTLPSHRRTAGLHSPDRTGPLSATSERVDMSTIQEMIAVMQAHADGKSIEMRALGIGHWTPSPSPSWNWASWEYRVAEDPMEKALRVYLQGCYDGDSARIEQASRRIGCRPCKKGLEAVISAVKSGELS